MSCGSGGIGTPAHLLCVKTNLQFGVKLLHVPYKGTGQSINDLLGGRIDSVYASMPVGIAHVRSGKLRALAMTSAKRSPQAPDLPTFVELGIPGFISDSWWGIIGPRGMPGAAVSKMSDYRELMSREGTGIYGQMAGMGLADVYCTGGRFEQAIELYRQLSASGDTRVPVDGILIQLGRAYTKAGKIDEAASTYTRIVEEFPQSLYAADARAAPETLQSNQLIYLVGTCDFIVDVNPIPVHWRRSAKA